MTVFALELSIRLVKTSWDLLYSPRTVLVQFFFLPSFPFTSIGSALWFESFPCPWVSFCPIHLLLLGLYPTYKWESIFSISAANDGNDASDGLLIAVLKHCTRFTLQQNPSVQILCSLFRPGSPSAMCFFQNPLPMPSDSAVQGLSIFGDSSADRHHNPNPGQLFLVYSSVPSWEPELCHILFNIPSSWFSAQDMYSKWING